MPRESLCHQRLYGCVVQCLSKTEEEEEEERTVLLWKHLPRFNRSSFIWPASPPLRVEGEVAAAAATTAAASSRGRRARCSYDVFSLCLPAQLIARRIKCNLLCLVVAVPITRAALLVQWTRRTAEWCCGTRRTTRRTRMTMATIVELMVLVVSVERRVEELQRAVVTGEVKRQLLRCFFVRFVKWLKITRAA